MTQSEGTNTSDHLGTLFVEVTGRSTVTETQHDDGGRRTVEPADERYARPLSDDDGLDDAVETPERQGNGY